MKTKILIQIALICTFTTKAFALYTPAKIDFEEDTSVPIVYLNIISDAGAVQDPQNKLGLAQVAGQMLLRGTQKHLKKDFFKQLDLIGGNINVDVRAEGIVLRGSVLSENLQPYLSLLEEVLTKPKFTAEELRKVKKEIESNFLEQMGNDQALVGYHFSRFFYGTHPYGNPLMGTPKTIKNITSKDVIQYFAEHFGRPTLSAFGSGDAKKENLENWFAKVIYKLEAIHPEARAVKKTAAPQISSGRRALIIDKPKATQAQILIGGVGMRPDRNVFYDILLANHSFGGPSFNARMMKEIRVKRGWTYGASNNFRYASQPKHFAMYMFPKTADTAPAIELSLKLFSDFVSEGITSNEFNFAMDSLVNNAPFNFDTPKKRLENISTEHLLNFPKGYFANFANEISKVKSSNITNSLQGFFHPENLTLVVVGDASKLKEPISKITGFENVQIKKYTEE